MNCQRLNDNRSFVQKIKDFIFGEKLTDEEKAEQKEQEQIAHAHILGAGSGATGKVEIIRSAELHEGVDEDE